MRCFWLDIECYESFANEIFNSFLKIRTYAKFFMCAIGLGLQMYIAANTKFMSFLNLKQFKHSISEIFFHDFNNTVINYL
jgi:hypothetical protein